MADRGNSPPSSNSRNLLPASRVPNHKRITTLRFFRHFGFSLRALVLTAGAFSLAQASAQDWQKSYSIAGKANLSIATGDAALTLRSCSECHAIKINVDWRDRHPSDFNLKEVQSGDQVTFQLEEKAQMGIHFTVRNWHSPQVTVETPASLDLEAKTSDGALKISGVEGNLQLRTSDGAVDVEDVGGSLHLTASDGSIKIHNLTGTLESRSSDGRASIDGKFSGLQVHTSDGSLDLNVQEGSHLASSSRIESSDGHVTVHLPHSLAADLDVHAGDGKIECTLPLTMDGFSSEHGSGHNLRGHLNGGGPTITIHTSDGNVSLSGQ